MHKKISIAAIIIAVSMLALLGLPKMFAESADSFVWSYDVKSRPVCAFEGSVAYPADALEVKSIRLCEDSDTYYSVDGGKITFNGSRSENTFDFSGGRALITIEFGIIKDYNADDIKLHIDSFYTVEQYESGDNEPFEYSFVTDGEVSGRGKIDLDDTTQSYTLPEGETIPEPTTEQPSTVQTQPSTIPENPERISGDVNSDTNVNMKDIVLLQQYINKWDVAVNEKNADVTGDGNINMKDIVLLQQYINKWDVVLK